MAKPIFLFSLPRAGSTLAQRILASHKVVSSFAEPHFLLPILGMLKSEGTITYNSHQSTHKGIMDVVENLPNGEEDFFRYVNSFSMNIYNSLSEEDSRYFLDKTPRYIFHIDQIAKIFPEAKFIFLFRNPIQIFASIVSTFGSGRFNKMYGFHNFLNEGFETLSKSYEEHKDRSISIRYDDLLLKPEQELKKIFDYLEVQRDMKTLENFQSVDLVGRSVDPTGTFDYTNLDATPLAKWKEQFNSGYRNRILKKYIDNLDDRSLEIQGYSKADLMREIDLNKRNYKLSDVKDFMDIRKSKITRYLNLNLYFDKKLSWTRGQYLN